MPIRRSPLVVLAASGLLCAPPALAEPADEPAPVVVRGGPTATWLQPTGAARLDGPRRAVPGDGAAVITLGESLLSASDDDGILGLWPMAASDLAWIAVDGDDAVWMLGRDDRLTLGPLDPSAQRDDLGQVSSSDFVAGDAAGEVVALLVGTELTIYRDRTPDASPLPDGFVPSDVVVRSDRLVVITGKGADGKAQTLISRDAGASWTTSIFAVEALARQGARITNGSFSCLVELGDDGATWFRPPERAGDSTMDAESALQAWEWAYGWTTDGQWTRADVTFVGDSAPAARPASVGRVVTGTVADACPGDAAGYGGLGLRGTGRSGSGSACDGWSCVGVADRYAEPGIDNLGILADGLCNGEADGTRCADIERPHGMFAWADGDRLHDAFEKPEGCATPVRVDNARGAALLACSEDGGRIGEIALWSTTGAGVAPSPMTPMRVGVDDTWHLTQIDDGTLGLHRLCGIDLCELRVMDPTGTWHTIDGPAVAYRLVHEGVLTIEVDDDERARMVLHGSTAAGGRTVLADPVAVPGIDQRLQSLEITDDGSIVLVTTDRDGDHPSEWVLLDDGTWASE